MLGVGSQMVSSGTLTAGALIAFILYLDQFFSPVQQLSQVFDTYQQASASMRRINELMETPTSTPAPAEPVPLPAHAHRAGPVRGRPLRATPAPATKPCGASTSTSRPGEVLALVGETGAGKSTIVKLIARFHDPTAGRVLVDGVPWPTSTPTSTGSGSGYVPQEAFLFTGTIRDNIAFGRPDASDAEVEASARAVGRAHASSPGSRAATSTTSASGAGRCRRASGSSSAWPGPTSSTRRSCCSTRPPRTSTSPPRRGSPRRCRWSPGVGSPSLIAHRLQTAQTADRIAVMVDGRIAELGSHDQLLARDGSYASMWEVLAA